MRIVRGKRPPKIQVIADESVPPGEMHIKKARGGFKLFKFQESA